MLKKNSFNPRVGAPFEQPMQTQIVTTPKDGKLVVTLEQLPVTRESNKVLDPNVISNEHLLMSKQYIQGNVDFNPTDSATIAEMSEEGINNILEASEIEI